MSNTIENNRIYNTFTPFISKNTQTADRTLRGRRRRHNTSQDISKSFFKYFTPSALLLIPVLAITVSRTHLNRMLFNADREYFLAEMKGGFIKSISKKCSIAKYYLINKLSELITPLKQRKDRIFSNVTNPENKTLFARGVQTINGYFKKNKIAAAGKRTEKVKKVFEKLVDNIEKQLKTIDDSALGKIKTLLPDEMLKTKSDGMPRVIDFSKTKDGKSRTDEIKKLIDEIRTLLKDEKPEYDKIIQKITYSCDDIFDEGMESLIKIRKELSKSKILDPQQRTQIKKMYGNLVKYKFAELIEGKNALTSQELRALHLEELKQNFEILKTYLPDKQIYKIELEKLEKLLNEKANPENMGILEKIRMLLKCNDIKSDLVKENKTPALFKQYQTEEYIKTKELIKDFAKELKIGGKTEKYMLPNSLEEINNGKIFTHAISTLIPTGALLGTIIGTKNKEKKNNTNRTLAAFLIGAVIMFLSYYFAICSRRVSIAYGLLATLISTKIIDKFIQKN
ncbi:MAG: hypothetical protein MJ180_00885 [Candidatus Gastranaerophilales bacterium]|nr:hypothetical protein [Candidatus Gastranaerophilales bacterium]